MKKAVLLINALTNDVPTPVGGGDNVVIFSDWPITVIKNGKEFYKQTLFLTLEGVDNLALIRENIGTVPDGIVEIFSFRKNEFVPPSHRPFEQWGNYEFGATGLDTSVASPKNVVVNLPGGDEVFGVLMSLYLAASAAGVALNRVDIFDSSGSRPLWGRRQATAQFIAVEPGFIGIKVPNSHIISFSYTPTVASTTDLIANYKIGG